MNVLAIDCATDVASVALLQDNTILFEESICAKNKHSETILPLISSLLENAHLSVTDIDAFATSVGPGSFTGIRIAVSTIKGLAFASNKPCIGVSVMEAMAHTAKHTIGILSPIIDARRDRVYQAFFQNDEKNIMRLCDDRVIPIEALLQEIRCLSANSPLFVIGENAQMICNDTTVKGFLTAEPIAASIARIAQRSICQNQANTTDIDLAPYYLRPTQAERERMKKIEQEKENTL